MTDIILTHGFFLDEDPREQQIMRPYPPLGILYISAYLKTCGIQPVVLDTTFLSRNRFESILAESRCRILGIYTTHMTRASVIRQIHAATSTGYTVVLGGPDSAGYPEEYLRHGADIIVIGEGETTLADLIPRLAGGESPRSLSGVPGLVVPDGDGGRVRTPVRPFLDIDTIPWPDRDAVDLDGYMAAWKTHHGETSINLITARGCRYHCRWCSHAVFGNTERRRDPVDCAEEVLWIRNRYAPDQLWFADDVFTMDHEWIYQFSRELHHRRLHIPFETISRADRMQDRRLVSELARMGCRRIWIGSESGSDRILRAMNRGVTAAQVVQATQLARENGIETGMFLMWGYEGETPDDMALTIDHVIRADPDIFFTTRVHPIRATPYYMDIRHKITPPDNWATASDKDILIQDRKPDAYFNAANQWLRNAVAAHRLKSSDPDESARCAAAAELARGTVLDLWND